MLEPSDLDDIRQSVRMITERDRHLLDDLREDARVIGRHARSISPRSTTSISLVASDGGNNRVAFDPFSVQLIRVVDSYGKRLCLDAVSPTTDTDLLSKAQFDSHGNAKTALGRMMVALGIESRLLHDLSYFIPTGKEIRDNPNEISHGWILMYRDLCEWAVLFDLITNTRFSTDTLIVRDGQLRTKIFSKPYFTRYIEQTKKAIDRIYSEDRRRVFLVGLSKHTNALDRYNLALALENVFPTGEAKYARIPPSIEKKFYVWPEFANRNTSEAGEVNNMVAGVPYFARFGSRASDPTWAVDVFMHQDDSADEIFSHLMADSLDGFPVPFYPRCLQKAHEHAQVVDFDMDIIRDVVAKSVAQLLPESQRDLLDALSLRIDAAARRYL